MINRQILITATLFGGIAVIFGAFGAHGLRKLVAASELDIWAKAVQYQFYHTFALLFLAVWKQENGRFVKPAYYFFTAGILLFSGSLYLLTIRNLPGLDFIKYIGTVTPLGGLLLISGWASMFLSALKNR